MKSPGKSNTVLFLFGISLFILMVNISNLSPYLSDKENLDHRMILLLVFLLCLAGLVYLYNIRELRLVRKSSLTLIIAVGILMRLVCIYSAPILEDDFYRYLWDGAVLANGENPYEYSPEEIIDGGGSEKLRLLAAESGEVIKKINNRELKTIYPSIAQIPFAVSYLISPWSVTGWKLILFLFDIFTLSLLIITLRHLQIPVTNVLIYWWNPLLIKEIFNSGHMDVLVFPIVLLSLLLFLKNKKYFSTTLLSLGVGIKLWPVFLLPLFLKPDIKNFRRLLNRLLLFAVVVVLIFTPVLLGKLDSSSGFIAYSKSWENNSSFFRIILAGFQLMLNAVDIHPGHAQSYARTFILGLLSFWILFVVFWNKSENVYNKSLLIIAAAFLISPTQFPWYYTWVILFLSITPHISLLSLTALLPFYYLRYHFEAIGNPEFFSNIIVWIEFVPVWIFIFWALKRGTLSVTN